MPHYSPPIMALGLMFLGAMTCDSPSKKNTYAYDITKEFSLNEVRAKRHMNAIALTPHPHGSEQQRVVELYISDFLQNTGIKTITQTFESEVPNPLLLQNPNLPAPLTIPTKTVNIIAYVGSPKASCVVALGSHYDSKGGLEALGPGANDSGSSTVALLEILQFFNESKAELQKLPCAFLGIFFDGEEARLPNWDDGMLKHPAKIIDNRYGSRHLAATLYACGEAKCFTFDGEQKEFMALVLMDMIGNPNIILTNESNSNRRLLELARSFDRNTNTPPLFPETGWTAVQDDHISFIEAGIPAINLIDFSNLQHWHKPTDTMEKISYDSISKTSKIAIYLATTIAANRRLP
tara:strand:+ start:274 stop:1323 length:1050 start_codon:yes stop_codon:yes gene_type:complete